VKFKHRIILWIVGDQIIMESEPGAWTRIRIALPEDADGTGGSGRPLPEPTRITGRNGATAG
jgi:hypothetical protein